MSELKASDLRIGNYVLPANSEIPERVNRITEDSINTWGLYLFRPIPLTPEILLKAGFEKLNKQNYNNSDTWAIGIEMPHSLYDFIFELETSPDRSNYFYKTSNPIKYVHQLMNLYHSLTSHELTINI